MFPDRYEVRHGHPKGVGWSRPTTGRKFRWKKDARCELLQLALTDVFVWDRLRLRVVY